MTTARAITQSLAAKRIQRSSPKAIYLVLMDGARSVCYTESALDTWFLNLTPEEKAELCERHHDGPDNEPGGVDFEVAQLRCLPALVPFMNAVGWMDQAHRIMEAVHDGIPASEAPDGF